MSFFHDRLCFYPAIMLLTIRHICHALITFLTFTPCIVEMTLTSYILQYFFPPFLQDSNVKLIRELKAEIDTLKTQTSGNLKVTKVCVKHVFRISQLDLIPIED